MSEDLHSTLSSHWTGPLSSALMESALSLYCVDSENQTPVWELGCKGHDLLSHLAGLSLAYGFEVMQSTTGKGWL